jgi:hypothetical protein
MEKGGGGKGYERRVVILMTAFNSPKRLLTVKKGNKIRWNTLLLGLSRRSLWDFPCLHK